MSTLTDGGSATCRSHSLCVCQVDIHILLCMSNRFLYYFYYYYYLQGSIYMPGLSVRALCSTLCQRCIFTSIQTPERSYAWPPPSLSPLYFLYWASFLPVFRTFILSWFCMTLMNIASLYLYFSVFPHRIVLIMLWIISWSGILRIKCLHVLKPTRGSTRQNRICRWLQSIRGKPNKAFLWHFRLITFCLLVHIHR
jgi:hypothetical protein